MKNPSTTVLEPDALVADDIPILYEEELFDGMGEADIHSRAAIFLFGGIEAFVNEKHAGDGLRTFFNLNVYYRKGPLQKKTRYSPCVSPDVFVVKPTSPLPKRVKSYTIGDDRPVPILVVEVLSERTAKDRDLDSKPVIYAKLGVREYILADPTGEFLPERLLLKRLQSKGTWKDRRDAHGGITSELGFRVILESDGQVRVLDAATGEKYLRFDEAQQEAKARQEVEEENRRLKAELARLRKKP